MARAGSHNHSIVTEPPGQPVDPGEALAASAGRRKQLRRQTARGMVWMLVSFGTRAVLQVVFLAILARLVSPKEFGLVSGALIVVFLTTVLAESGVGAAIVQRKELTREHLRVGFTLSVLLGLVCWAALFALAPQLEDFLRLPGLTWIVRAIAFIFVINNLTLSDYLLSRRLQFGKLALAESLSSAVGYGSVTITLAALHYGAWAIVGGQLAQSTVRTVLVWVMAPHPWQPLIKRDVAKELFNFGAWYTVGRVALWAATQGDNLVTGRYLGAAALGLYGRAYQLVQLPANLFGQVAQEVLFPAMAAVQSERETLKRIFGTGMAFLAVLALPVSMLAAVTSRSLVLVLFGHRWIGLTAAFDVIVFGMIFRTSSKMTDALAKAAGSVFPRAWRAVAFAGFVFTGAYVGKSWGIRGVATGVLIALAANYLLTSQLCLRIVGMSWSEFAAAHAPAVLLSVVAGGVGYAVDRTLAQAGTGPLPRLAVAWSAGLSMCLLIVRIAWRTRLLDSVAAMVTAVHALLQGKMADVFAAVLGRGYRPRLRQREQRPASDRSPAPAAHP